MFKASYLRSYINQDPSTDNLDAILKMLKCKKCENWSVTHRSLSPAPRRCHVTSPVTLECWTVEWHSVSGGQSEQTYANLER